LQSGQDRQTNGSDAPRSLAAAAASIYLEVLAYQSAAFAALNTGDEVIYQNGMNIAPVVIGSKEIRHHVANKKEKFPMLWTILVILLVLWLVGFLGSVGGSLIHLLLVIALIVLIINLVSGRRAV
jgi:hypothetical protein